MLLRAVLLATLISVPALAAPAAGPDAGPDAGATAFAATLRDTAARGTSGYTLLESLSTEVGQRLAGTEAEARGRDWAVAKMQALGFANVRVDSFKVPLWIRGAETAEVTAPYPQRLVVTALGNSGATPAAGIEAQVVRFASFDDLLAAPAGSLAGKIAFLDHYMMPAQDGSSYGAFGAVRFVGPSIAASKGATAVVIRSLGTSDARVAHTGITDWENALPAVPVTGGSKAVGAKIAPIPAGALSVPDGDLLRQMFERGQPVRMKLVLTPAFKGEGVSGNVIGEIPGRSAPQEIVLIGGHLDSWDLGTGAVDDGAGVVIAIAAAQHIKALAKTPPRRTIRVVLFGAEEIGGMGGEDYGKRHGAEKHVLAMESDFGADRIWKITSHVAETGVPTVRAMQRVLAPLGIGPSTDNANGGGSDLGPLGPTLPTLRLHQDGTRYFDLHHTANDTLDKVDPAQLEQNVAAYAVTAWLAADSDVAFGPAPALKK
jgi:carboxypeptidase Q